jgi:hypothetical protein
MVEVDKFDTIVRYDFQLLSHVLVELVGVLIADLVAETRLHQQVKQTCALTNLHQVRLQLAKNLNQLVQSEHGLLIILFLVGKAPNINPAHVDIYAILAARLNFNFGRMALLLIRNIFFLLYTLIEITDHLQAQHHLVQRRNHPILHLALVIHPPERLDCFAAEQFHESIPTKRHRFDLFHNQRLQNNLDGWLHNHSVRFFQCRVELVDHIVLLLIKRAILCFFTRQERVELLEHL